MARRRSSWRATAARIWRKCFSTLRAGAGRRKKTHKRLPDETRGAPHCVLAATHLRDGAALLLSAALVLAAPARAHLLAGRADADVGLPAALRLAECRLLRARGRHLHRRRAA